MSSENENQPRRIMSSSSFHGNQANNNYSQNAYAPQPENKFVPEDVKNHFNWGAFFLTWIWGLGNNTFITLLIFATILVGWIPIIGFLISLGVCIWFGIKGNEWAWKNKHFISVQAFHEYQKKWAIAGVIVFVIMAVIVPVIIATLTLPVLLTNTSDIQSQTGMLKAQNMFYESAHMINAMGEKCELSSNGLAKCFSTRLSGDLNGNVINQYMTTYTFNGNGRCKYNGDCEIIIKAGEGKSAKTINVPLFVDNKGFIDVYNENTTKALDTMDY